MDKDEEDRFVCPQPAVWGRIHTALLNARAERNNPSIPLPPIPLILAAWWEVPALFKMIRWKETLAWAEEYGFRDRVPALSRAESYFLGD